MIVPEKVLELLLINYHLTGGKKVLTTDKDYNDFSIKVADKTATNPLHCNTWKRVFRHLRKKDNSPCEPSQSTLEIISSYLGYGAWEELMEDLDDELEHLQRKIGNNHISGIQPMTPIDWILKKLKKGDIIEIKYYPNRILLLEFIRKDYYKVVSSKNSLLEQGDTVYISMFAIGYPLMISEVIRNGISKGKYQSAHGHNIQSVNLYKERSKYDFD